MSSSEELNIARPKTLTSWLADLKKQKMKYIVMLVQVLYLYLCTCYGLAICLMFFFWCIRL